MGSAGRGFSGTGYSVVHHSIERRDQSNDLETGLDCLADSLRHWRGSYRGIDLHLVCRRFSRRIGSLPAQRPSVAADRAVHSCQYSVHTGYSPHCSETFEQQKQQIKSTIKVDTRSNALRVNKIPMQCEYCGEPLPQGEMGVYKCVRCGREHFDEFKKIRNFLEENGPASALEISRGTGVAMPTIREYFSDKTPRPSLSQPQMPTRGKEAWHFNRIR